MFTGKTSIEVGLLIAMGGALSWIVSLYSDVKANAYELTTVRQNIARSLVVQDDYQKMLLSIDQRLARIEGKLGLNK